LKNYNEKFLLVGAGSKAVLCDLGNDSIISLSKGIKSCRQTICGYIDIDQDNAQKAVSIYGGEIYKSIEDAVTDTSQLNIVVSSPDQMHYKHIIEALQLNVKGIFAEKPLALNSREANKILSIVKEKKIKFEVNYFRRFLPSYIRVKNEINQGVYGELLYGRGIYDKGLFHNGSHLLNLVYFLFDKMEIGYVIDKKKSTLPEDDNYVFQIIIPGEVDKSIIVQSNDESNYTVFELELYFDKKVIKIVNFGRNIYMFDPSEDMIPNYKSLVISEELNTEYMESAHYSIKSYLESDNYDNLVDAVKTIEICERIVDLYEDSNIRL